MIWLSSLDERLLDGSRGAQDEFKKGIVGFANASEKVAAHANDGQQQDQEEPEPAG